MADPSNIVDLQITIQASGLSRPGFGVPCIGGYHNRTTGDRVSTYNETTDMTDDGFAETDLEYLMASAVKSAESSPDSFKVARLGSVSEGPTQIMDLTATTAVSTRYAFELAITGSGEYEEIEFTSSPTANNAEILAGIKAAVDALGQSSNITAATASGSRVRLSGASAGKFFNLANVSRTFSNVTDETADPGIASDINDVLAEDSDWYALLLTYKGAAIQAAAAALIQTLRKMYITATMDREVATAATDDIGTALHAASYTRTIVIFNDDHMKHPDGALAGVWLPYQPGEETLMFKQLIGQVAGDLSASQITNLKAKKVNYYVNYGGQSMVADGVTSEGKYADLIRFIDWLFVEIQYDVLALLIREPKVAFTVGGITQVQGVIDAALQRGVRVGGLQPGYVLTVPALEDITTAQKEARNFGPVKFSGESAGAIQGVTIRGTVAI